MNAQDFQLEREHHDQAFFGSVASDADQKLKQLNQFRHENKEKGFWYFLNLKWLLQWCFVRPTERKALTRLAKRISYMSLYKYTYKIDEHEEEVEGLKRTVEILCQQNKQLEKKFNKQFEAQQLQIEKLMSKNK